MRPKEIEGMAKTEPKEKANAGGRNGQASANTRTTRTHDDNPFMKFAKHIYT